MAPGLRCTGVLSETWPKLPIALKFAHPTSVIWKHFEDNYTLFRIFLDFVPQLLDHSGAFRRPGEVVWVHLKAHRFAFNLSGSNWEHLESSVWLFRVAELFSSDFQTILHFADNVVDTEDVVDSVDPVDTVNTVGTVDAVELETASKLYAPVPTLSVILQMHAECRNVLRREETVIGTFASSVASQDMAKSVTSPTNG
jgi:hypothetical protein